MVGIVYQVYIVRAQSGTQALEFGPPFFLIWSLPRLLYGSLSGGISLNHLSIFYNISCYNSLVLLTFVSRSDAAEKCKTLGINGLHIKLRATGGH
jgi:hypothetical protein